MMIRNYSMYSFESVKAAVLTDGPQLYGGEEVFGSHPEREDRVRTYTRAMHRTRSGATALRYLSGPKRPIHSEALHAGEARMRPSS
jgi:hypothetical protein